jgi:hypothetical protein
VRLRWVPLTRLATSGDEAKMSQDAMRAHKDKERKAVVIQTKSRKVKILKSEITGSQAHVLLQRRILNLG